MNKLVYFFSMLIILASIVFIGILIYWSVYPYEPFEFIDPEFIIANKVVKRGEMVFYTSNYCKYIDASAHVTRTFVNDILYVTPTTITNRPIGCHSIRIGVLVPSELPPGEYHMEQVYKIQVNPIRTITIQQNTEPFTIQ